MDILDELIRFPVILIDGIQVSKDDKSHLYGGDGEEYPEYIVGEAEEPYGDFSSIMDVWPPSQEGYDKAKQGIFTACNVDFGGKSYTVPMNKEKFKKKIKAFSERFAETEQEQVAHLVEEIKLRLREQNIDAEVTV